MHLIQIICIWPELTRGPREAADRAPSEKGLSEKRDDPMKETTLSKITASVAVAKGMAQRAGRARAEKGKVMPTGKLKIWNAERGFGFIQNDAGGPDMYLRRLCAEGS